MADLLHFRLALLLFIEELVLARMPISTVGRRYQASRPSRNKGRQIRTQTLPHRPRIPWKFDASEEPQQNRFLRRRQLPVACRPVDGEPMTAASRSKQSADGGRGRFFIGPFSTRLISAIRLPGLDEEQRDGRVFEDQGGLAVRHQFVRYNRTSPIRQLCPSYRVEYEEQERGFQLDEKSLRYRTISPSRGRS